jgi:hypothetical protein
MTQLCGAPRAKARACTPKCRPAVGRRYGTQAWLLHMLRRAEPSEAYPTTLLMSFEGYPPSHSSSDAIGYGRRRPRS